MDSVKYPLHLFKIGYFRSSYNTNGYNSVVSDLIGKSLYETKARDIMSTPLVTIEADCPMKQALEVLRKHNIRRLAVTEGGVLVGIITERRLFVGIFSEHI